MKSIPVASAPEKMTNAVAGLGLTNWTEVRNQAGVEIDQALLAMQNGRCAYCERPIAKKATQISAPNIHWELIAVEEMHVEHMHPRNPPTGERECGEASHGPGYNAHVDWNNIVACCGGDDIADGRWRDPCCDKKRTNALLCGAIVNPRTKLFDHWFKVDNSGGIAVHQRCDDKRLAKRTIDELGLNNGVLKAKRKVVRSVASAVLKGVREGKYGIGSGDPAAFVRLMLANHGFPTTIDSVLD